MEMEEVLHRLHGISKKSRRFESMLPLQPDEAHRGADLNKVSQLKVDHSHLIEENEKMLSCRENSEHYQKFSKQRRLITEEGSHSNEGICCFRKDSFQAATSDPPNISEYKCYVHAQPILDPIWRGSLSIHNEKIGAVNGMATYLSTQACTKVSKVAHLLPESIPLEMLPRLDVWPKRFGSSEATDGEIGLFFFPEKARDENAFDNLMDCMIGQDLAMNTEFDSVDLLLFTSLQLPLQHWSELKPDAIHLHSCTSRI